MAKTSTSTPDTAPVPVADARVYVAEADFLGALGAAITGNGDSEAIKVVDMEVLLSELRGKYPEVKANSIRQRIYKINKALEGRRKFAFAAGPDSRRRDLEAYMAL